MSTRIYATAIALVGVLDVTVSTASAQQAIFLPNLPAGAISFPTAGAFILDYPYAPRYGAYAYASGPYFRGPVRHARRHRRHVERWS